MRILPVSIPIENKPEKLLNLFIADRAKKRSIQEVFVNQDNIYEKKSPTPAGVGDSLFYSG
jgi:hypothetical protein